MQQLIAISIGKNNASTGSKMVPNPNPEKKVTMEAKNATIQIMMYSMGSKINKKPIQLNRFLNSISLVVFNKNIKICCIWNFVHVSNKGLSFVSPA